MNKIISLLLIVFNMYSGLTAQECNCIEDYQFIVEKIESEHPGFKINVNKNNIEAYEEWKSSIQTEIQEKQPEEKECLKLLNKYLSFIKDKHLKVYKPKRNETGEIQYKKRPLPSFKSLDDEINYAKVPSFHASLWRELDSFYDSITPLVKEKKYLIVDIRNNGGGGERMYNQLLKLVKKEKELKKVVFLFNGACASACEEVAMKVSSIKKVTTMGQNTYGGFAYGFIKGLETPSQFVFIITTRKYPKRLPYEYNGYPPEIKLNKETDWIEAAVDELAKDN
ncbi:MAG: S41 family peptidase [Bacteroidota bacterium]